MRTITTINELRRAITLQREMGKVIGFVPTMGALHEGHQSLMRMSRLQTDITVVSIFVNPSQFGIGEDFDRYPRTLDSDQRILVEENVDFLFLPTIDQIYPDGQAFSIQAGPVGLVYEGAIRPGHFNGVATVVSILFNIVQPSLAFFGQKDAQQLAVIRKLVRDLAFPVEIIAGPIIRDDSGLALSSRNRFLNLSEKVEALALSKSIFLARQAIFEGKSTSEAKKTAGVEFHRLAPSGTLDYLDIVDPETFQQITSFDKIEKGQSATIIIAAHFGATRLIDNIVI